MVYYLLKTRTTRTPAFWGYPPPPHDYPYHWVILDPKSKEDKVKVTNLKKSPQFFELWNGHYTRHTFWSCLIRCANMNWIRWVFTKIQSGHDSVHRRTDGQGDTSIPPFQLRWSEGYKKILLHTTKWHENEWVSDISLTIFFQTSRSRQLCNHNVLDWNHHLPWHWLHTIYRLQLTLKSMNLKKMRAPMKLTLEMCSTWTT